MRRLVFLADAVSDLTAILNYITAQSGSRTTARAFVDDLRDHCRKLARLPGTLGRPRPELREGMRSSPFRGYVVFFHYAEDRLEVIKILEAHRDVDTHFDEG